MLRRTFATQAGKVALLGAGGGIGQPLALLLKDLPGVKHLSLYDIVNTQGIAADLSHISTASKVTGHTGEDQLKHALEGAHTVVIPAGVPRKPGMTRDDLFNINATIVFNLATAVAKYAPNANIAVISNPVNSTVPIVAQVLKKHGVYNAKRLFGVTTLDVVRAKTFVGELKGQDPNQVPISVIGGHSGVTILPLFSQLAPKFSFSQTELEQLTHRVQFGGDEVVKAKAGAGSATLSMAYAARVFVDALLKADAGQSGQVQAAYVESSVVPGVPFFSTLVELGKEGVQKIHPIGVLSAYEKKLLDAALPELKSNIEKGNQFAQSKF